MNETFIIDSHIHLGTAGQLVSAGASVADLVSMMDRFGVRLAVCSDHAALLEGFGTGLARARCAFAESAGRLRYLGVFDPRAAALCLSELAESLGAPGFVGVKIHPSCHATPADDDAYGPVWAFAAEHKLPILTHSWSVSDYNPAQVHATPARFERWVREFPAARLILAHAGGRGAGRHEAVRLVRQYANVYLDFAGDIFCYRLVEQLVASVPVEKILFGSDFPWMSPADHLTRVLLARASDAAKERILCSNAAELYRLGEKPC